jgi:hypothetical protein
MYLGSCLVHLPLRENQIIVAIALRVVVAIVHWCTEIICAVRPLDGNSVRRHRGAAAASIAAMLMEGACVASGHGSHWHGGVG